jgi:hypothetical protein
MGIALKATTGVGIMGIAYQAGESVTDAKKRYPNLIDQLVAQKLINVKAYSLYLDDKEQTTGSILYGGIDTAKFIGTLQVLPIQPDPRTGTIRSFTVQMSSLAITDAGTTSKLTNSTFSIPVILDSGTTISYVPPELLASVMQKLGAVDDRDGTGAIFVDCDWRTTKPNLFLNFGFGGPGGPIINVPISEMIRSFRRALPKTSKSPFKNTCNLGLSSSTNQYLLGDTFLRSAYLVYDIDHNQIALAQTNFESTESNIQEISASATGIPVLSGKVAGNSVVPQSHFATTGKLSSTNKCLDSQTKNILGTATGGAATRTGTGLVTGTAAGDTAPTVTKSGALTTGTAKSAATGTIPSLQAGSLTVFAISIMFILAGGSWLLV